jgi:hypothetical protein
MKKQMKKLTLAKETVQSLESVGLEGVAAAASVQQTCQFICLTIRTNLC